MHNVDIRVAPFSNLLPKLLHQVTAIRVSESDALKRAYSCMHVLFCHISLALGLKHVSYPKDLPSHDDFLCLLGAEDCSIDLGKDSSLGSLRLQRHVRSKGKIVARHSTACATNTQPRLVIFTWNEILVGARKFYSKWEAFDHGLAHSDLLKCRLEESKHFLQTLQTL